MTLLHQAAQKAVERIRHTLMTGLAHNDAIAALSEIVAMLPQHPDPETRPSMSMFASAADYNAAMDEWLTPPALQHQEVPREPFARGSWQHAVDDQLSALGRTSQEFSTPREAVCWLLEQSAEAARTIAPHKTLPAEPTSEILEAIVGAAELEQGDPEDHRYDDGQEAARAIYKAVLAACPSTTQQQEDGNGY